MSVAYTKEAPILSLFELVLCVYPNQIRHFVEFLSLKVTKSGGVCRNTVFRKL